MGNIQDSLSTLHGCKAKYAGSKDALEAFQPDWENRQILVPLTSSMYVPGRIKDLNNFIIDIGTGYYIEKVTNTYFSLIIYWFAYTGCLLDRIWRDPRTILSDASNTCRNRLKKSKRFNCKRRVSSTLWWVFWRWNRQLLPKWSSNNNNSSSSSQPSRAPRHWTVGCGNDKR